MGSLKTDTATDGIVPLGPTFQKLAPQKPTPDGQRQPTTTRDGDIPDPKTRLAEAETFIGEKLGRPLTTGEIRELQVALDAASRASCRMCNSLTWLMLEDGHLRPCPNCTGPEPLNRRLVVAGFLAGEIPLALHAFKPERQPKGPAQTQAKAALAAVGKWLKSDSAPTLLLAGPAGVGKTLLAQGAALELCNRRADIIIATGYGYSEAMRRFEDGTADRYRARLKSCGWLVFDDLAAQSHDPSGYLLNEYQSLIDERYRMARPTLVTTNHGERELTAAIGPRGVSRLYDTSRSAQVFMPDCVDLRRARS